jgi:anti-sigma B factor antagonist
LGFGFGLECDFEVDEVEVDVDEVEVDEVDVEPEDGEDAPPVPPDDEDALCASSEGFATSSGRVAPAGYGEAASASGKATAHASTTMAHAVTAHASAARASAGRAYSRRDECRIERRIGVRERIGGCAGSRGGASLPFSRHRTVERDNRFGLSRARTRDASVKYSLSDRPGHTVETAGLTPLTLEFEGGDGRPLRAIVVGEIDFAGAPSMQAQIASACARRDEHRVVLDLSAVQFMDSSGLRAVLHTQRALADEPDGGMVILGATEPVRKLLKLTGLERHLRVFDTLEQAETALAEGEPDGDDGAGSDRAAHGDGPA